MNAKLCARNLKFKHISLDHHFYFHPNSHLCHAQIFCHLFIVSVAVFVKCICMFYHSICFASKCRYYVGRMSRREGDWLAAFIFSTIISIIIIVIFMIFIQYFVSLSFVACHFIVYVVSMCVCVCRYYHCQCALSFGKHSCLLFFFFFVLNRYCLLNSKHIINFPFGYFRIHRVYKTLEMNWHWQIEW